MNGQVEREKKAERSKGSTAFTARCSNDCTHAQQEDRYREGLGWAATHSRSATWYSLMLLSVQAVARPSPSMPCRSMAYSGSKVVCRLVLARCRSWYRQAARPLNDPLVSARWWMCWSTLPAR